VADIDVCYDVVQKLPLKRYTWKRDAMPDVTQVYDRSKLGWIAQDVKRVLPKSVETRDVHGLADCQVLNADQLYAVMYGAIQKSQMLCEHMADRLNALEKRVPTSHE
jgi:hypothetical protein